MYRKTINFDRSSFLEVASRLTGSGQQLMLSLRGPKNEREITQSSALMTESEVRDLIAYLSEWLNSDKTLPNVDK